MHRVINALAIIIAAAGCAKGGSLTYEADGAGGTATAAVADGYIVGATGNVIVEHAEAAGGAGGSGGATTMSTATTSTSSVADAGAGGAGGAEPDAGPPLVACCDNSECPALAPCITGWCQFPLENTCDEARCNAFCRCQAGGTPMSTGQCVPGPAWTCVCAP